MYWMQTEWDDRAHINFASGSEKDLHVVMPGKFRTFGEEPILLTAKEITTFICGEKSWNKSIVLQGIETSVEDISVKCVPMFRCFTL
jgi:hypothetical protein